MLDKVTEKGKKRQGKNQSISGVSEQQEPVDHLFTVLELMQFCHPDFSFQVSSFPISNPKRMQLIGPALVCPW